MVNRNLVGRCGLYCGACIVYRAYKDSAELRESVAREHGGSPEDVMCEGCQTVALDGWDMDQKWGKNCSFVACLDERGLDFCYQCGVYQDCEKFRGLTDSCLKQGEDLRENLEKIKAGKVDEWLQEEDRKWRCQRCGNPVSMHLTECHWCGEKLEPT